MGNMTINNNKIDYFKVSLKEYKEIRPNKELPSLLVHVCCGACSCFPLLYLINLFDITVLFSNSNIYPYEEYNKRKQATLEYINYLNTKFNANIKFIEDTYNYNEFRNDLIKYKDQKEGMDRCKICISKRLHNLFLYAIKYNFNYVTTIMSISRNKNVYFINEEGKRLENEFKGIRFLQFDFKKFNGQDVGVEISKKLNIYRQDYCGCEFSKGK